MKKFGENFKIISYLLHILNKILTTIFKKIPEKNNFREIFEKVFEHFQRRFVNVIGKFKTEHKKIW